MLPRVVQDEMDRRRLGLRPAAKEMGIAHTTLLRVLNSEPVDLDTLLKVSEWAGMSLSNMLGIEETDDEKAILATMTAVVDADPELRGIFLEAHKALLNGEIKIEDLRDIANYAAYKLSVKQKGRAT